MGRRLVDFGCGTGGFLVEARLAGLAADGRRAGIVLVPDQDRPERCRDAGIRMLFKLDSELDNG